MKKDCFAELSMKRSGLQVILTRSTSDVCTAFMGLSKTFEIFVSN